ncbi:hypothetical protein EVA_10854 [gut metagenome]|uniref:Uncharacterized protein n=1 Tax=gut metagenome TaxID=749906 RepID=J9GGV6_9ZZZZ
MHISSFLWISLFSWLESPRSLYHARHVCILILKIVDNRKHFGHHVVCE